jgi:hypothetical protein
MRALIMFVLLVLFVGCEGDLTRTDSQFATPERTVSTLLASHGLDALTQDEIRARMAAREHFSLEDGASFRACFIDAEDPVSEGLAGWVLGAIAAGRDDLRIEIFGERATVTPREGVRIVMLRQPDATWRITLRESVPEEIRRALSGVAQRHDRRARAKGLPVE